MLVSPRRQTANLVFKIFTDGNELLASESVCPIKDVHKRQWEFQTSMPDIALVRNNKGLKIEPFRFGFVSKMSSVFWIQIKINFKDLNYSTRLLSTTMEAASLEFQNIEGWFSGSMRDVRDEQKTPRVTGITIPVLNNDAKINLQYVATTRFDEQGGVDMGEVAFKQISMVLNRDNIIEEMISRKEDKINACIGEADFWLGRANSFSNPGFNRNRYVWKSSVSKIDSTKTLGRFPSRDQMKEEQRDRKKAKTYLGSFTKANSSRSRSSTIDITTETFVPDSAAYSNPVRKLPYKLTRNQIMFQLIFFNNRYEPPAYVKVLYSFSELLHNMEKKQTIDQSIREATAEVKSSSRSGPLTARLKRKQSKSKKAMRRSLQILSPRKQVTTPPVNLNTLNTASISKSIAKNVYCTLEYEIISDTVINITQVTMEAIMENPETLNFVPIFK